MKNILRTIKDSNYSLALFDQEEIKRLEERIQNKDGKFYITCASRFYFSAKVNGML